MSAADWAGLLRNGDYQAAHDAWRQHFGGREDSLEATGALAEIEECWGDSLFFTGEPGAAPHYHSARAALAPPGLLFPSLEESESRMAAHRRVTDKLYAIDPYGKARGPNDGQRHPHFRAPAERAAIEERKREVARLRLANQLRHSGLAALFQNQGHWAWYDLGEHWNQAGAALATDYPRSARRAFEWSMYYFEAYNREWTAHLPASRWDSDGGEAMAEVQGRIDALPDAPDRPDLPQWIGLLLQGDWRAASAAIENRQAPEWSAVEAVLQAALAAAK